MVQSGLNGNILENIFAEVPKLNEVLLKSLGITSSELALLITKKLNPHQSEQVLDIVSIQLEVISTFDTLDNANEWLFANLQALDGFAPISFLDTFVGRSIVRDVLVKIKFGEFS
ncbi:antitoxin Xre/MbcA/ParS toxin-binding domain-containing protein [Shewanella atlantica]|uniref:DUF2384 domain-containing protein n=1 Tax=Shewanella atlantica TaxID=271099 RepID=A0A431VXB6_9GAMM|nr:DUF2384 domain-containing protein [Shewanella atlantica]